MSQAILSHEKIRLNANVQSKKEAIQLAGKLLLEESHITEDYIEKMLDREEIMTTYIGNGVAIPHGTNESKKWIKSTGISIVQIPNGVNFGDGNIAYLVIGIAGLGNDHLELLSNIAVICSEQENVQKLVHSSSAQEIINMFTRGY